MGLTRTYLDSNTVLDIIDGRGRRGRRVRDRLRGARGHEFVISPLVRLECLVRPLRRGDKDEIALVEGLLANFKTLSIDGSAFELATHMRARHGLKTPDALHLAAAHVHGCGELWTSDRAMLSAAPELAIDVSVDE